MIRGYNFVPNFVFEPVMTCMEHSNNYRETVSLAHWSMNHKDITMNLPAFLWPYAKVTNYPLYRKLIYNKIMNAIKHEVTHGAIQKIMEQDKWSGSFSPEWPMENGMDSDYARVVKRLKQ